MALAIDPKTGHLTTDFLIKQAEKDRIRAETLAKIDRKILLAAVETRIKSNIKRKN